MSDYSRIAGKWDAEESGGGGPPASKLEPNTKYAATLTSYRHVPLSKAPFAEGEPEWRLTFEIVEPPSVAGETCEASYFPFQEARGNMPHGAAQLATALRTLGVPVEREALLHDGARAIADALERAVEHRSSVWIKTQKYPGRCFLNGWRDTGKSHNPNRKQAAVKETKHADAGESTDRVPF